MSSPDFDRLEELYLAADALPPEARERFLDERCGDDRDLREELERLLAAGVDAEAALPEAGVELPPPPERPEPETIGGYRILGKIGEGGFGVVYRAEQRVPVRRQVALKLIKPGMDSKAVLARFDAERQALALMDHAHIARIFDGGMTSDGRPYFVMEFVRGSPITDYCDGERLGTNERIKLVQQACLGVHHAHQKGIIHRDLKPANILVEVEDGQPSVKIIDFGVAKAVGQQLTEQTLFTAVGQLVGTPDYMSPEQVRGNGLDIDTRTDVYALGSVLYELLTGVRPLDLRARGFDQMVRTICEEPPSKPSTRVSTRGGESTTTAERRNTDLKSLSRELRADLDWITLKALEKDRNRRYASASDLAEDLGRHLRDEPVLASPPSAAYRLRKFANRHRALVSSIALIGAILVVSSIVSAKFGRDAMAAAVEADRERDAVLRLSAAQELADLKAEVDALWPMVPGKKEPLRDWLERADELVRGLETSDGGEPGHHAQLAALRARALPLSDEEREEDRRTHPRFQELEFLRAGLASLRRAQAVREGKASVPAFELDAASLPEKVNVLCSWAAQLAGPGRTTYGREAEGLALARAAVDRAGEGDGAPAHDALAWALFTIGLDEDALQASRDAVQAARPKEREHYEGQLARLQANVEAARVKALPNIAEGAAHVARLEEEVSARRTYRFARAEDARWHALLEKLVREIETFADEGTGYVTGVSPGFGWGIQRRLAAAERIEELTLTGEDAKARWNEATASIADRAECPAYGGLELRPQIGLLPIGRDPASGLWELAHVASGEVPERDWEDELILTEETGLVFVLIPGGESVAKRPYSVSPFFVSKYEMTQGQWLRFTGENPSIYGPTSGIGVQQGHDLRHPVEMVSWSDCETVLWRLDLSLPTEAQWKLATRAGTRTAWWTGKDKNDLADAANLMDQACRKVGSSTWEYEAWDDGYGIHAPVGTYRPNPFGLHDVIGNVWEWCWDGYEQGFVSMRAVDPVREPAGTATRIFRGGSYFGTAQYARMSYRRKEPPDFADAAVGVRPARRIDP